MHQGHSWADMHLRVASHFHPSPLSWTTPINLKRCLRAHSVEQALNSSLLPGDFHNMGPQACENCKDQSHVHRNHSPTPLHLCPLCSSKLHVASTATEATARADNALGGDVKVSLSVAKFDRFENLEDQVSTQFRAMCKQRKSKTWRRTYALDKCG